MQTKRNTIVLFSLLLLITVVRIYHIYTTDFNLFFDEAQYWDWSRTLDFGYYSKPPVVAWVIHFTTFLFGDAEWAIRLGSPLAHLITGSLVFCIARRLYDQRTAFFSSLAFATLPSVSLSSSLISTDPFLIMFWALGIYAFIRTEKEAGLRWWLLMGIAGGMGMLSKYTMVLFFPSVMLIMWWRDNAALMERGVWHTMRHASYRSWFSWPFIVCCAVAFVIYVPNFYWNAQNGFVSFLHTKDNANLSRQFLHPLKALEFLGGQFGMFGLFFVVLIWRIIKIRETLRDNTARMLLFFVLPFLGLITVISFLSRAHANWAAPVYVSAMVLVIAYLLKQERLRFMYFAIGLNVFLAIGFYTAVPVLEAHEVKLAQKTLRRIRGWQELGEKVLAVKAHYPDATLLTDSRKLTTELLYYTRPHPVVKWNSHPDSIKDHYDLTTRVEVGKHYLFITKYPNSPALQQFEHSELVAEITIPIYSDYSRHYRVYYLWNFQGY